MCSKEESNSLDKKMCLKEKSDLLAPVLNKKYYFLAVRVFRALIKKYYSLAVRVFRASIIIATIVVALAVKDFLLPSAAKAALPPQTTSIARSSKKTLTTVVVALAVKDFLLPSPPVKGSTFSKEAKKIPKPIFGNEIDKPLFARKVDRPLRPPSSFLTNLEPLLKAYDTLNNEIKKQMEPLHTFIKNNKIVDPRRIELVTDTYNKLAESNLCYSKRVELVSDALEIMSRSCQQLVSNIPFTDQHKEIFLQETGVAIFLLERGFPPKDEFWSKTVRKVKQKVGEIADLPDFAIGNSINYSDPALWDKLQYNGTRAMASNMAAEIRDLRWHVGLFEPYFSLPLNICTHSSNFFKKEVSFVDKTIKQSWDKNIKSKTKDQQDVFIYATWQIHTHLRHQTFIDFCNECSQTNYGSELFNKTGIRVIDNRLRRSVTELAEEYLLKKKIRK